MFTNDDYFRDRDRRAGAGGVGLHDDSDDDDVGHGQGFAEQRGGGYAAQGHSEAQHGRQGAPREGAGLLTAAAQYACIPPMQQGASSSHDRGGAAPILVTAPAHVSSLGQAGQAAQAAQASQIGQLGQISQVNQLGQISQVSQLGHIGQVNQLGQIGQLGQISQLGQIGQLGQISQVGQLGQVQLAGGHMVGGMTAMPLGAALHPGQQMPQRTVQMMAAPSGTELGYGQLSSAAVTSAMSQAQPQAPHGYVAAEGQRPAQLPLPVPGLGAAANGPLGAALLPAAGSHSASTRPAAMAASASDGSATRNRKKLIIVAPERTPLTGSVQRQQQPPRIEQQQQAPPQLQTSVAQPDGQAAPGMLQPLPGQQQQAGVLTPLMAAGGMLMGQNGAQFMLVQTGQPNSTGPVSPAGLLLDSLIRTPVSPIVNVGGGAPHNLQAAGPSNEASESPLLIVDPNAILNLTDPLTGTPIGNTTCATWPQQAGAGANGGGMGSQPISQNSVIQTSAQGAAAVAGAT